MNRKQRKQKLKIARFHTGHSVHVVEPKLGAEILVIARRAFWDLDSELQADLYTKKVVKGTVVATRNKATWSPYLVHFPAMLGEGHNGNFHDFDKPYINFVKGFDGYQDGNLWWVERDAVFGGFKRG